MSRNTNSERGWRWIVGGQRAECAVGQLQIANFRAGFEFEIADIKKLERTMDVLSVICRCHLQPPPLVLIYKITLYLSRKLVLLF